VVVVTRVLVAWGEVLGCEFSLDVQAAFEVGEVFMEAVGFHAVFDA